MNVRPRADFALELRDGACLDRIRALLEPLVAFETTPGASDGHVAAAWLRDRLERLGFSVRLTSRERRAPLLLAERPPSAGARGHVAIYGHYDVEHPSHAWTRSPFALSEEARWFGLGVGDNKGALAARLVALELATRTPKITWIIQGEEECGSALLRESLAEWPTSGVDLWLDENGWDAEDGTQQVLLEESALGRPLTRLVVEVMRPYVEALRVEERRLRKHLVPGGCAFQASVPAGARYLAIGLNDAQTRIHQPDESISPALATRHVWQLMTVLEGLSEELD